MKMQSRNLWRGILVMTWLLPLTISLGWSQSNPVYSVRIQFYSGSQFNLSIHEITYRLRENWFIADSIMTSETQYYETTEQQKAAKRKQKKEKTVRENIKGLFVSMQERKYPVQKVGIVQDTIASSLINTTLSTLNESRNRALETFGITAMDIESYLEKWRMRRNVSFHPVIDSVAKELTPTYEITPESLKSCDVICSVQSHGGSRHGVRIFVKKINEPEKELTSSDQCNVLPMTHFINLVPLLESFPEQLYNNKNLYNRNLVLELAAAAIYAKRENKSCVVRADLIRAR